MLYGHNNTVHSVEKLNVVVDKKGKVTEVWFRCMALPFTVGRRDTFADRYQGGPAHTRVVAVEVESDAGKRYQVFRDTRGAFPGYEWLIGDTTCEDCLHIVGFFGNEGVAREFARQLNLNGYIDFEP